MRFITCLFWLFFASVFIDAYGQNDITLPGLIAMQNSQYKTGQREYVVDANVKATSKCTPTTSDSKGEFVLVFSDKPAGDAATIFIDKDGLEVVNGKDLEEAAVVGRLSPLKVYMCKKGELEKNKEAYYLISDSAIQSIYNLRLKALMQKQGKEYNSVIASLEKELKDTINNSDEAIAALNAQLQEQKKQIQNMVNQFAIENLDDQSKTYQRAFTAFTKGDIDTALAILDSVDLEKRLQTNTEQIQKEQAQVDKIQENIELKQQQIQQDVEQALLDARMHKLKYQFKETEASYDLVVKYDSTNYDYYEEYIDFLMAIRDFDKAITASKNALKIFSNLDQSNSLNKWHVAEAELAIGTFYFQYFDLSAAEKYYLDCSRLSDELIKTDPVLYAPKVADQKSFLGLLYTAQGDTIDAKHTLTEALNIQKNLAQRDSFYWTNLASKEVDLGIFYTENNFPKADSLLKDALHILLVSGHDDEIERASVQEHLGDLYNKMADYEKSKTAYDEALKIYKKYVEKHPLTYKPDVAIIEKYLAKVYTNTGDYFNAEQLFLQALADYNSLINLDASGFEGDVAEIKLSLGTLYDETKDYTKAETYYLQSINILDSLSKLYPHKYLHKEAETEASLGFMYENENDYIKSETHYLCALALWDTSLRADSVYQYDFANTQNDLGVLYDKTGDYIKSESFYLKALNGYIHLSRNDAGEDEPDIARTENNLGLLYNKIKEFTQAESEFTNALKLRNQLAIEDPDYYEKDVFNTAVNLISLYRTVLDNNASDSIQLKYYTATMQFYQQLYKKSLTENPLSNIDPNDCGSLSWYLLFIKKFKEAETAANWALQLDSSQNWIKVNYAHALLFQGRYEEAEKQYLSLKELKDENNKLYKISILEDFDTLEKAGITYPDVKKIRDLLIE